MHFFSHRAGLSAVFTLAFFGLFGQPQQPVWPNLSGQNLLDQLVADFKPATVLTYSEARDTLYSKIYKLDDSVECVYTGHKLALPGGTDPSQWLSMNNAAGGINCEHGYPQSKGAADGNARSDMHHLFPTWATVNSSRGNVPYGESPDGLTEAWFFNGQSTANLPTANLDEFAERGPDVFEPREVQKGNSARAVFYFFAMYQAQAMAADPLFFELQRPTLCQWAKNDPVDQLEWARTWAIAAYQNGRANPFVLDPSLPERCFCPELLAENEPFSTENEPKISPNPTAGPALFSMNLEKAGHVRAVLFDPTGRRWAVVFDEKAEAGPLSVPFETGGAGLFFLKIEAAGRTFSKPVLAAF